MPETDVKHSPRVLRGRRESEPPEMAVVRLRALRSGRREQIPSSEAWARFGKVLTGICERTHLTEYQVTDVLGNLRSWEVVDDA